MEPTERIRFTDAEYETGRENVYRAKETQIEGTPGYYLQLEPLLKAPGTALNAATLDTFVQTADIVGTGGAGETAVMSQKAVTDALSAKASLKNPVFQESVTLPPNSTVNNFPLTPVQYLTNVRGNIQTQIDAKAGADSAGCVQKAYFDADGNDIRLTYQKKSGLISASNITVAPRAELNYATTLQGVLDFLASALGGSYSISRLRVTTLLANTVKSNVFDATDSLI